jgi:hypothetical protein
MIERHYPDPTDRLRSWARGFVRSNPTDTLALLADLNAGVRHSQPLSRTGSLLWSPPSKFAVRVTSEFGHTFAFSGAFQEYLIWGVIIKPPASR